MKNGYVVFLTFLCLPIYAQKPLGDGITELATQITASATRQEKQKIAVLPFRELDGQATVLGTYVAEELVTNLFQLGNFKIVERQLLDKVMGELKIQRSGAIDPTTAKEIGRIAAVDAIVTGSITDFESFVAVHCRLIDTTTGEVFGAAQTKITKDEDLKKIMRFTLTPEGTVAEPRTTHQRAATIATKDVGALRVTLKSVLPVRRNTRSGYSANGIMCTFDVINREARRPVVVAVNAHAWEEDNWPRGRQSIVPLRASCSMSAAACGRCRLLGWAASVSFARECTDATAEKRTPQQRSSDCSACGMTSDETMTILPTERRTQQGGSVVTERRATGRRGRRSFPMRATGSSPAPGPLLSLEQASP